MTKSARQGNMESSACRAVRVVELHATILMARAYVQLAKLAQIVQKSAQRGSGGPGARRSARSARTPENVTQPRGNVSVRPDIVAAIAPINVLLDGLAKDASQDVLVRMMGSVTL